jgi:hypothetical protein
VKIRKQAAQRSAVHTIKQKQRFYMDFGFMRASTSDFSQADKLKDCVVLSYDEFSSYLLIIGEASHYIWVFLTKSNDPPIDIVSAFLRQHGLNNGGCICTDQGSGLAQSDFFVILFCTASTKPLNPLGQTACSKMVRLKLVYHCSAQFHQFL